MTTEEHERVKRRRRKKVSFYAYVMCEREVLSLPRFNKQKPKLNCLNSVPRDVTYCLVFRTYLVYHGVYFIP